jgi:signal peptidase II
VRKWPWAIAAGIVVADRATKYLIETRVSELDTIRVVPGLFQIMYTRNTGVSFSMFAAGEQSRLLVAATAAILAVMTWMLWRAARDRAEHFTIVAALACIVGGAAGNLYDRLTRGGVTDFLDFYWGTNHFPAFNVADSSITVGAGLLLVGTWLVRKR